MATAPRYFPAASAGQGPLGGAIQLPGLLHVQGTVRSSTRILSLHSPTHQAKVQAQVEAGGRQAGFSLADDWLDGDLVLVAELEGRHRTRVVTQDLEDGLRAVLVRYCPPTRPQLALPGAASSAPMRPAEYIFLLDRSGSMMGPSIRDAADALALCVSALPLGCRFNIVGFGSTYEMLFNEGGLTVELNSDQIKDRAMDHCRRVGADLNGTELLPCLQHIASTPITPGHDRFVVVLTDGCVGNTDDVLRLVQSDHRRTQGVESGQTRYFSLGIGRGVSHALVTGLAEHGGGESEFVVPGERLQAKVMRQMSRMMQPCLTDLRVDWSSSASLILGPAPSVVPRLPFSSSALLHAIIRPDPASTVPLGITLHARLPDGSPISEFVDLRDATAAVGLGDVTNSRLDCLVAHAAIREIEKSSRADKDAAILALSLQYQVASTAASFLAVLDGPEPTVVGSVSRLRVGNTGRFTRGLKAGAGATGVSGLNVRTLTGKTITAGQAQEAPVTVADLKQQIWDREGIPANQQRLVYGGQQLEDHRALADYSVQEQSTIHLVLRLRGGDDSSQREEQDDGNDVAVAAPGGQVRVDHVAVVTMQRVDGHWEMTEQLIAALHLDGEVVKSPVEGSWWATALVLAVLEDRCSGHREEWAAAALKGRKWLRQVAGGKESATKLIVEAIEAAKTAPDTTTDP